MSTLYADPSDDFSLPKRAQVRTKPRRTRTGTCIVTMTCSY